MMNFLLTSYIAILLICTKWSFLPAWIWICVGLINQDIETSTLLSTLSSLENLSCLENLQLEETRITDAALCPLSKVHALRYLSLGSCYLTDASLHHLTSLQKLVHLGIRNAVLTNAGLDCFNPPPTLKVLDLMGCWLLTKDDIVSFCNKHLELEVRHDLVTVIPSNKGGCTSSVSGATSRNSQPNQGKMPVSPARFTNGVLVGEMSFLRFSFNSFLSCATQLICFLKFIYYIMYCLNTVLWFQQIKGWGTQGKSYWHCSFHRPFVLKTQEGNQMKKWANIFVYLFNIEIFLLFMESVNLFFVFSLFVFLFFFPFLFKHSIWSYSFLTRAILIQTRLPIDLGFILTGFLWKFGVEDFCWFN